MATELELKRGQELFKALLRNNGYETALVPFLDKYRQEDNKKYSFTIILKYMQLYATSEYVSKEEIIKYNKLRSISKNKLLQRGKEICETLMANGFLSTSIEPLGERYALEDKRYLPYSKLLLDRMRKMFLETASKEFLEKYNEVLELAKRSTTDGLDFDILRKIVGFEDLNEALKYIKELDITQESLRGLRNAYFHVYPDDLVTRTSLDAIESFMLEDRQRLVKERIKEQNIPLNEKRHQEKIDRLKRILISFINSGKDNLEDCIKKEGITTRYFFDTLDMEVNKEDADLNALYMQYLNVDASFAPSRRQLVETLQDYYDNGVYYGQENRRFSLYDYYVLTDKSIEEVRKILRTYLPIGKANKMGIFLGNLVITSKFSDRQSFIEQLKRSCPNVSKLERDIIIEYIEDMNWPYSITLFKDILARLVDGLIVLPEKTQKSTGNLNKI